MAFVYLPILLFACINRPTSHSLNSLLSLQKPPYPGPHPTPPIEASVSPSLARDGSPWTAERLLKTNGHPPRGYRRTPADTGGRRRRPTKRNLVRLIAAKPLIRRSPRRCLVGGLWTDLRTLRPARAMVAAKDSKGRWRGRWGSFGLPEPSRDYSKMKWMSFKII